MTPFYVLLCENGKQLVGLYKNHDGDIESAGVTVFNYIKEHMGKDLHVKTLIGGLVLAFADYNDSESIYNIRDMRLVIK